MKKESGLGESMRGFDTLYNYIVSLFQVFCVFLVALFLPKLFVIYASLQPATQSSQQQFKLGIENVSSGVLHDIKGRGSKKNVIGLVTNHTGMDQLGVRTVDILLNQGVKIAYIFTPKHGYNADKQTICSNDCCEDATTHIPLINWHDAQSKRTLASYVEGIDVLLFDMQDSGVRHGYVATLLNVMKTAQHYGKKLVVFDRPNLLGSGMEGSARGMDEQIPSIPIRYGMTIGELALYFNTNSLPSPVDLQVVPMEHYQRGVVAEKSKLVSNLSPNIPTLEACYGYSFLGLLGEVAPFDVGLGTQHAFQCVALPESLNVSKQVWFQARGLLKERGIESKLHRYFSKRKKSYFAGLLVSIKDINDCASFSTFLDLLRLFKKEGIKVTFSPQFDAVLGTDKVRLFLEGNIKRADLAHDINASLRTFFQKAAHSFIYAPLPKIVPV